MIVDILVAEIGSTTTKVNCFDKIGTQKPVFLGQGMSRTTVEEGDVGKGLEEAIENLKKKLHVSSLSCHRFYGSSSAAGGLRMSVHGLVREMTVRAAREAALGAGANILLVTAGKLKKRDLDNIEKTKPNIIMISGGVDSGDTETQIFNSETISCFLKERNLVIPVLYAGNSDIREDVADIFRSENQDITAVENVYPQIDRLVADPARKVIHDLFEKHIIHAPGMSEIRRFITGDILPTPGAVMLCAKLFAEKRGSVVVFDVGGATTDVHSVTDGSGKYEAEISTPEPDAKRTVEGDLGVYVNRKNILEIAGEHAVSKEAGIERKQSAEIIEKLGYIPVDSIQERIVAALAYHAVRTGLERHAGSIKNIYSIHGKHTVPEGKDLSAVRTVIGTGGAFSRLREGEEILKRAIGKKIHNRLVPDEDAEIIIDRNYIMSSVGVLSVKHPEDAEKILFDNLERQGKN